MKNLLRDRGGHTCRTAMLSAALLLLLGILDIDCVLFEEDECIRMV
jgi:hypothetical protein